MDREDEEDEFDEDAPYPLPMVTKLEKAEESDEEGCNTHSDSKIHSGLSTNGAEGVTTLKNAIKNEDPEAVMTKVKEESHMDFDVPADRSGLVDEVGVMEPSVLADNR